MTSKRLHLLLLAVIAVVIVTLVGGAYESSNLLAQQSTKLTALKAKDQALTQEHLSLAKAKKEIKDYANLVKITRAVVPEDKSQAESVREIVNIAGANGIKLASITFPASTLGNTKGGTAATGGSASGAAAAPPSASAATTALSQLIPVKNIPGVYLLVINVQGDPNQSVPYSKFITFLSDLEHNRRTAQVSNIIITPDSQNRNNLTFTLSLNEYIKP